MKKALTIIFIVIMIKNTIFSSEALIKPEDSSFAQQHVKVLQQNSATPFILHEVNLETGRHTQTEEQKGDGTMLGNSNLKWSNIRSEEGTNCGYHALKNSSLMLKALQNPNNVTQQLADPTSELSLQLTSREPLLTRIAPQVQTIHAHRTKMLKTYLQKATVKVPEQLSEDFLKTNRQNLQSPEQKAYININDGHIKTEMLNEDEMNLLLEQEPEHIRKNTVILNPQIIDPGVKEAYPLENQRLTQFQNSNNDTLAILWTEPGLNHWVTYVADKKDGKVTLYILNSIENITPIKNQELMKLLNPTKQKTDQTLILNIHQLPPHAQKPVQQALNKAIDHDGQPNLNTIAQNAQQLGKKLSTEEINDLKSEVKRMKQDPQTKNLFKGFKNYFKERKIRGINLILSIIAAITSSIAITETIETKP